MLVACGLLSGCGGSTDAGQAKLAAIPGVRWDTSPSMLKGSIVLVANPMGFADACKTVENDLVLTDGSTRTEAVTVCPDANGVMIVQAPSVLSPTNMLQPAL